jgi:hypothetical protein
MDSGSTSLRWLVEKWLQPSAASPARIVRMKVGRTRTLRCVRVEVSRATEVLSFFFFRHKDGSWCVFPPNAESPAMTVQNMVNY